MKGLQNLRKKQTTAQQPANTASSLLSAPSTSKLRTGKNLSGAFLLLAVITAGIYGAAPNNDAAKQVTANSAPAAAPVQLQTKQDTTSTMEQPSTQPAQPTNNSQGTSTSTSVNTVNGQTEVRVNGQVVTPDTNGSVNKTLNTDNGTVHISVDQSGTNNGGGSSSSSVDYNSFSSSNNSNTSWNDTMSNDQ